VQSEEALKTHSFGALINFLREKEIEDGGAGGKVDELAIYHGLQMVAYYGKLLLD
jgi:hypothetical protein